MAAVKLLGKWGYIDTTAKLIIPYQYSTANPFRKGKAIVSEIDISGNVRFFSIDKTGTEIKYNEAEGGE